MRADKILLVTNVYDQGDVLGDYLQWYLDMGIDAIVVQEYGSTDNSIEVLDRFAATGRVTWFALPERDMRKYDMGTAVAAIARDRFAADWIVQCDADEFLCPDGDLRAILRDAERDGLTALNVPCLNMTGPVLNPGQSAPGHLRLRIDRPTPVQPAHQVGDDLPVPHIFMKVPPKTIVRASALVKYGAGTHGAAVSWGHGKDAGYLRFLHFPIRGYDKFEKKIQNTAAWLNDNPHLEAKWGWHWRRFIRLHQSGRLREEYEAQFVSPAQAESLVRDEICSVDDTVARWVGRRL